MKHTRNRTRLPALMLLAQLAAALMLTACASADQPVPTAAGGGLPAPAAAPQRETEGIPVRAVIRPDRTYSMDDLVAAGYKKSKQFSTETVPHAQDVWYGFFNRRDIEVRVYASHRDALDYGVQPAEEVIARKAGQYDYLIPVVNLYPAYMVVGNMVMLCERELAVCQDLVDELP